MKQLQFLVLLVTISGTMDASEPPIAHRVPVTSQVERIISRPSVVSGTFYTGTLNWIFQAGGTSLSMRGYETSALGGTIDRVTACLYNESAFSRRFTATVEVRQGLSLIQSIEFARDFPSERSTCHSLRGFNAEIAPGEFSIIVSYDVFDSDNVFLALPATDEGQIFDVQIGSQRPPHATDSQGPVLIRGVGIRYLLIENDEPPPPPPDSGSCQRNNSTACLLDGRFQVTVDWQTSTDSGVGQVMYFDGARAESEQSVFMWFFNDKNFEMGIKMVNACAPPFNSFWVFVSGLTNQGFTVRIEDTVTGEVWTHENPLGNLPLTRSDTSAFDCP